MYAVIYWKIGDGKVIEGKVYIAQHADESIITFKHLAAADKFADTIEARGKAECRTVSLDGVCE